MSGGNLVPATLARSRELPAIRTYAAQLGLCRPGQFTHHTATAILDMICFDRSIAQREAANLTLSVVVDFLKGKVPRIGKAPGGDKVTADFLIVTALEEERDAVLSKLDGHTTPPPSEDDVRYYYVAAVDGTFSDGSTCVYNVALVSLANMGRVQAANTASDAIRYWRPRYVMLVGIAGGLSSSKVCLGDILIADLIVDYELQKVTESGPEIRWNVHQVDQRLLEFALNFPPDKWHKLVREKRPNGGEPARHKGTVATGDKVITVNDLLESYKKQNWPKLIGVEMEAGGVAPTAHQSVIRPGFFMVRCVSDLLSNKNQKKVEGWRNYACDLAASYAIAMIRNGPVPPGSPLQRRRA